MEEVCLEARTAEVAEEVGLEEVWRRSAAAIAMVSSLAMVSLAMVS